ncbi:biotinidase isoform X2 [Pyxicephalus adspersus]|uniref:Biotinidase n=2 Tax=Pyxicephalus adspersus TaxID=30357 RepID=A0AAV3AM04_PYXAD|nr:TPA: hypothetical protein GDO54_012547 [Pyxicephalus adspersus]
MASVIIRLMIQAFLYCLMVQIGFGIEYYVAAVYEHHSILNSNPTALSDRKSALEFMFRNLDIYEQQVNIASKKGVQIIVFPEDGIHGFNYSRMSIYPYLDLLPSSYSLTWNPCLEPNKFQDTEVLQRLSCMAKEGRMFVVANLGTKVPCEQEDPKCPPDGRYHFNTNVVFSDNGTLIARYFKQNLYFEYGFDIPPHVQHVIFHTPFARFGLFTCFDILFYEPVVTLIEKFKVKHLVYPTAWMNQLPLLSSIQIHRAFATGFNINILAANIHHTTLGMSGSGIFSPLSSSYHFDMGSENGQLIIAKVPVDPSEELCQGDEDWGSVLKSETFEDNVIYTSSQSCHSEDRNGHCGGGAAGEYGSFNAEMMYDNFTFVPLNTSQGTIQVCGGKLCCYVTYQKQNSTKELYALGVFDGLHTVHGQYSLQICALVKCGSLNATTCGQEVTDANGVFTFKLWGNFSTKYVFPMIVTSGVNLQLPDWWGWKDNHCYMRKKTMDLGLVTAALYGRYYERD